MTVNKECIRDKSGKIIGWIETDHLGNKLARDFYGRIVTYGDGTAGLLYRK